MAKAKTKSVEAQYQEMLARAESIPHLAAALAARRKARRLPHIQVTASRPTATTVSPSITHDLFDVR